MIEGRVVRSENHEGIANANVSLIDSAEGGAVTDVVVMGLAVGAAAATSSRGTAAAP